MAWFREFHYSIKLYRDWESQLETDSPLYEGKIDKIPSGFPIKVAGAFTTQTSFSLLAFL